MKHTRHPRVLTLLFGFFGVLIGSQANGALTEAEAAQLGVIGTPLTPMGAIRAGNEAGTIPEWTSTPEALPPGYKPGGPYVDPYAADKRLFTITAANVEQYKAFLTPGQLAMFARYPDTYVMHVYPSRRSARFPDFVNERTLKTARSALLCGERCLDPSSIADGGGIPFPIPKDGLEVVFNSNFSWQSTWSVKGSVIVTTPDGRYYLTGQDLLWAKVYWLTEAEKPKGAFFERDGGPAWCFYGETVSPPRAAGVIANGCAFMKDLQAQAYQYLPGQRRVRRAPEIGFYDQPSANTDGIITDQSREGYYMSGSEEWFDHKLNGRKELFIPYNNYRLMDLSLKPDDIIHPGHINPEHVRYELHRVWEVDSHIRKGFRNIMPHQTMWYDEDSWQNALAIRYDQDDNIWSVQERPLVYFYDSQVTFEVATLAYDLPSARYASQQFNFPNFRGAWFEWPKQVDSAIFPPDALRQRGLR